MKQLQGRTGKYIEIAEKEICIDTNHLEAVFQDIIDKGGEGIILRDPKAHFQIGRSPGFLKHKVLLFSGCKTDSLPRTIKKFRDAEARIVGVAGEQQWECEL